MIKIAAGQSMLMLIKPGGERYIFIYDADHEHELVWKFAEFVTRRDLSLDWANAQELIHQMQRLATARAAAFDRVPKLGEHWPGCGGEGDEAT